jgi:vitamin B12 transporter
VSRDKSEDLPERVLIKELSGIKVMCKRSFAYIVRYVLCLRLCTTATFICVLIMSRAVHAQDISVTDTVNISAVTITAEASVRQSPFTVYKVDTATLALFDSEDLATLLMSVTPLTVKRYGNNGLASVSIRGMSGSHTLVTWNGLDITSPNVGSNDFTIIPVMVSSTVHVTAGGYDLQDIAGTIGGKIELSSEPSFIKGKEGSLTLCAGSYGEYASSAVVHSANEKISADIGLWGGIAENGFLFTNYNAPGGPVEERRTNSSTKQYGVTTDLGFRLGRSSLTAHLWYSDADRELPGPVTTVQQDFGERQRDRSVRSVLRFSLTPGKLKADITAGESYDINNYNNDAADLIGDNRSAIYLLKIHLGYRLNEKTEVTLNAGNEFQRARSLSYENIKWRNVFSSSFTALYSPAARLRLMLQARQMAVTGMPLSPEVTAGGTYMLSGDGRHIIKGVVSHNLKLPCLNDLYWIPGGNTALRPERSTGGEAAYSYVRIASSGLKNSVDITLHASRVNDLIQWVPGETGLWSAENIRSAFITGLEGRVATEVPLHRGRMTGMMSYAFNRSVTTASDILNDRAVRKQLIYEPVHHLNMNANVRWRFLRTGVTGIYESRRYTTSDNSEWLPPSFITDANIGAVINTLRTLMTFDFGIINLFNTSYESVRNYPMPLRTFNLRLKVTFSNKNKNI